MTESKKIAASTRWHRKIHRWLGSLFMVFLFIIALTGVLLGWKKNTGGYLLAESRRGTTTEIAKWLPLDSLQKIAEKTLSDSIDPALSPALDRIDARPDKGMIKFVFKDHFQAIQLDAATGQVLALEKRRADWIEKLHDGSIVDHYAGISDQYFKLSYTGLAGISLLVLCISGFWLWYNPKRIRRNKKHFHEEHGIKS